MRRKHKKDAGTENVEEAGRVKHRDAGGKLAAEGLTDPFVFAGTSQEASQAEMVQKDAQETKTVAQIVVKLTCDFVFLADSRLRGCKHR